MATWKKVIVSGSDASLNSLQVSNNVQVTGSLLVGNNTIGQSSAVLSGSFSGSFEGSFSGRLEGTASNADTASFAFNAISASFAPGAGSANSASFASTASSVAILNQPVVISGSLSVNTSTGNSFDINADTFVFTGSFNQTGSVYLTGLTQVSKSYVVGYDETTGQLTYQTAVDNADTASFAVSASYALTASYVENAQTASYVQNAQTASYVENAVSSSYALTASTALSGDGIFTGSFTGSFVGDGSQLTGVVATNAFSLTGSTGIEAFTYNGITGSQVAVSGAAALSSGSLTKWSGDAFVNSSISEDTGVVLINNAGGVLIQQGGLYVTGSSTFHDNLVVEGNLTVAGTASFQHSDNLAIADQFILLNSGSATFQDSGFVINTGNTGNSGSAFFLETAGTTTGSPQNGRFAVAGSVQPDATTVTAEEYANTTKIVSTDPTTEVPQFGGSGLGQGNMWVNTESGDIFIYA